jgi:hypothetical protein
MGPLLPLKIVLNPLDSMIIGPASEIRKLSMNTKYKCLKTLEIGKAKGLISMMRGRKNSLMPHIMFTYKTSSLENNELTTVSRPKRYRTKSVK